MNTVYKVKETRPFWKARGSAILVTVLLSFIVTLNLASLFGGSKFGCRSRRCHGGQRTRVGVLVFQQGRAEWLAANPGKPERDRIGR